MSHVIKSVLFLTFIGIFGLFLADTASDKPKRVNLTFKEMQSKCNQLTASKSKEIQLDIMYHCNNNTCVNYGLGYYMLQCMYNLEK